jgi:hypothetical protein
MKQPTKQRDVSHCVGLPFTIFFKSILRQKEELGKLKYFIMQKNLIFKKNPLKKTKILQDTLL